MNKGTMIAHLAALRDMIKEQAKYHNREYCKLHKQVKNLQVEIDELMKSPEAVVELQELKQVEDNYPLGSSSDLASRQMQQNVFHAAQASMLDPGAQQLQAYPLDRSLLKTFPMLSGLMGTGSRNDLGE